MEAEPELPEVPTPSPEAADEVPVPKDPADSVELEETVDVDEPSVPAAPSDELPEVVAFSDELLPPVVLRVLLVPVAASVVVVSTLVPWMVMVPSPEARESNCIWRPFLVTVTAVVSPTWIVIESVTV